MSTSAETETVAKTARDEFETGNTAILKASKDSARSIVALARAIQAAIKALAQKTAEEQARRKRTRYTARRHVRSFIV